MVNWGLGKSAYNRTYWQEKRAKVIELLGGKCAQCPWTDPRALQVDHIYGDGNKDKNAHNVGRLLEAVMFDITLPPESRKYQLLCANHNWIKRVEKSENRS